MLSHYLLTQCVLCAVWSKKNTESVNHAKELWQVKKIQKSQKNSEVGGSSPDSDFFGGKFCVFVYYILLLYMFTKKI